MLEVIARPTLVGELRIANFELELQHMAELMVVNCRIISRLTLLDLRHSPFLVHSVIWRERGARFAKTELLFNSSKIFVLD